MLNSGKKNFALCVTKKNILTLVLSEIFFSERNKKNITPPLQVKWSLLKNKLEEPVKKMTLQFVSLIPGRQKVNLIKQLLVVICILYGGGSRISS